MRGATASAEGTSLPLRAGKAGGGRSQEAQAHAQGQNGRVIQGARGLRSDRGLMRVAREGWPFVAGFFILGAGGLVAAQVLDAPLWALLAAASPGIGLGMFSLWFFRDPDREVPSGDRVVVSPADGRVVALSDGPEGPSIAIFLNVFDVHVNRAPVSGVVTRVDYRTGRYLPAFDGRAGDENEQNELVIESQAGAVRVRQIAGL